LKRYLENLLEEKAPGPYPSFSIYHVIKALELVAMTGEVGRGKLSEELRLGEGATRTLIERLKDASLISVSTKGCSLAEKGRKIWNEFEAVFPKKTYLDKNELAITGCSVAVHVKGGGERVKAGVEQRDAAIMAGAKGASTLVFRGEKLVMPYMSEDVSRDFPMVYRQVSKLLRLKENDAIVIGTAGTLSKAEYGALAAAWTLVENDCS
jgi:hypothetical protein